MQQRESPLQGYLAVASVYHGIHSLFFRVAAGTR